MATRHTTVQGRGQATNEHDAEQLRRALEQARSHPLFPVLDYMARKLHTLSEKLDLVDKKLGQLEAEVTVNFPASQKDVKDLIKEQGKKMFKIKGSAYEERLRVGVANYVCTSIGRQVSENDFIILIKNVMTQEDCSDSYKKKLALSFVKNTASVLRTEERRRVLGNLPTMKKYKKYKTRDLRDALMKYMKASSSKEEIYLHHLVILRKFVRENKEAQSSKINFYGVFNEWRNNLYQSTGGIPTKDQWKDLFKEDDEIDYEHASNDDESILEDTDNDESEIMHVDNDDFNYFQ